MALISRGMCNVCVCVCVCVSVCVHAYSDLQRHTQYMCMCVCNTNTCMHTRTRIYIHLCSSQGRACMRGVCERVCMCYVGVDNCLRYTILSFSLSRIL